MTTGPLLSLRRNFISRFMLDWFRKRLPPLSETERDALEAGTVGWDLELFSGRPDWQKLLDLPKPELTEAERAFLEGPVEELCELIDDWQINSNLKDLPAEVWGFIREKGFWGMIIPEKYGGLGFSALAHSEIIMKITTRSVAAAVTVMVPNSLGPAELLLRYGTEEQKEHYLPRLARGQELPCFAMTGPTAGSDAASMPDCGIVCYGEFNGERTLGMRVTWNKRYITLGPVATLMGLAFRLKDPDHLLGEEEDIGITLALVPTDTPGVEIGRRHYPSHQAFQNGPTRGENVFFPMDWVIGGQERVGQGWLMLMECLAAGRSISLPSLSTGSVKMCARTTTAYARVRKQFNLPIGRFEGVEEALVPILGHCYTLDAARKTTALFVDQGERPSVLSAIAKYHATMRMREAVDMAMDVHAGKGICDGPNNYLANAYYAAPVSITVEGANILTRSMIIFGQGIIRCHPYLLSEMHAAQNPDAEQALIDFDRAFFAHIGFQLRNAGRVLFHNLTVGRWAHRPKDSPNQHYYRALSRFSASFSLVAEIALLLSGGAFKRKERLSARFGDILSEMYLLSCILKQFEDEDCPLQELPLLQWCCDKGLYTIERRFNEVFSNFPSRLLGRLLRVLTFPYGMHRKPPADKLEHLCAELLLKPSPARDRLTRGMFISKNPDDPIRRLELALQKVVAADAVQSKLNAAVDKGQLAADGQDKIAAAMEAGILNEEEARIVQEAEQLTWAVISVDDFAPEELTRG